MKKKPIIFLVLKLIGLIGLVIFIIGIIKLVNGFGNFEDNSFTVGMFMMPIGLFVASTGLFMGFRPELTKHSINTAKYIQEENKEELKELIQTSAEIGSGAITTTVKAIEEGLKETIYCKYCGKPIDSDSQFCKHCGKQL